MATEFQIIPAIDLRAGRCVRLYQGDYDRETVYSDDPVAQARRWEAAGASRIHVVDLDAARTGTPVNLETVRRITGAVDVPVQMGGGVRDRDSVLRVLGAGVERAIVGTRAARDPENAGRLFAEFGESLVLGVDARDGRVAAAGWGETTSWEAVEFARLMARHGARRIVFTDIATDGTGVGPSLGATGCMLRETGLQVIASGGVGSQEHVMQLAELARSAGGRLEGIIVGRALYDGALDLETAIRELRRLAAVTGEGG